MDWQSLTTIEERPEFGKALLREIQSLNEQIESLLQTRADIDAQRAQSQNTDPAEYDFSESKSPSLRVRTAECLKHELKLRDRLSKVFQLRRETLWKARDKAIKRLEDSKTTVRGKLLEMGYTESGPSAVKPLFILSHPEVIAARNDERALSEFANNNAAVNANADAIRIIGEQLADAMRRAQAV
ncbi:MAG: hypothetical protein H6822_33955 [Planctomycetaceae bacterium]|nr:hypothetical protein [Planctomycetales bacterium]MCB9927193.1 hypothetical protein [Planctomycetaceae bacterium]